MPEIPKGNQNGNLPKNSTPVEFSFKIRAANDPDRFGQPPMPRPRTHGSIGRFGIAGALRPGTEQDPSEVGIDQDAEIETTEQ